MVLIEKLHWSEQFAEMAIKRNENPILASGITPSGIMHIGNLKDVMTAWYIKMAIEEKGHKSILYWVSDDFDALRKVPNKLSDSEGNIIDLTDSQKEELKLELGKPVSEVKDIFGCHNSYAEHFIDLFKKELEELEIKDDITILSSYKNLYGGGKLLKGIKIVLEKAKDILEIINKYRTHKLKSPYEMIQVKCPNCGKMVGKIIEIYEDGKVLFECTGKDFDGKWIEGCGFKGEINLFEPNTFKLDWKVDWATRWYCLDVTLEPFGKEHATPGGSWTVSSEICKNVFNREPPIPVVYEFFLVNGEKMSSSKGNCYNTKQMLEILEVEVFRFFYGKRLNRTWDLNLKNINLLVQEYDEVERKYFNNEEDSLLKAYYYANKCNPKLIENKIDYNFGAILIQLFDFETALGRFQEIKGIKLSEEEKKYNLRRLKLIKNWIEKYGPEYLKVCGEPKVPEMNEGEKEIIKKFAEELDENNVLELINKYSEKIPKERLFRILYNLLIGKDKGPRITTLIKCLGVKEVKKRMFMCV